MLTPRVNTEPVDHCGDRDDYSDETEIFRELTDMRFSTHRRAMCWFCLLDELVKYLGADAVGYGPGGSILNIDRV